MAHSFWRDTVIRKRPTVTEDSLDGKTTDWSATTDITIENCQLKGSSTDDANGRLVERFTLLADYGIDIVDGDAIHWVDPLGRLVNFDVVGRPQHHSSPRGRTAHVRVNLEVFDG